MLECKSEGSEGVFVVIPLSDLVVVTQTGAGALTQQISHINRRIDVLLSADHCQTLTGT